MPSKGPQHTESKGPGACVCVCVWRGEGEGPRGHGILEESWARMHFYT